VVISRRAETNQRSMRARKKFARPAHRQVETGAELLATTPWPMTRYE
jgi:hypothetical protein